MKSTSASEEEGVFGPRLRKRVAGRNAEERVQHQLRRQYPGARVRRLTAEGDHYVALFTIGEQAFTAYVYMRENFRRQGLCDPAPEIFVHEGFVA